MTAWLVEEEVCNQLQREQDRLRRRVVWSTGLSTKSWSGWWNAVRRNDSWRLERQPFFRGNPRNVRYRFFSRPWSTLSWQSSVLQMRLHRLWFREQSFANLKARRCLLGQAPRIRGIRDGFSGGQFVVFPSHWRLSSRHPENQFWFAPKTHVLRVKARPLSIHSRVRFTSKLPDHQKCLSYFQRNCIQLF